MQYSARYSLHTSPTFTCSTHTLHCSVADSGCTHLFVGVYGCPLVVLHELVERGELALPDAVQRALHVHAEVLVAARRLQRHAEVTHLGTTQLNVTKKKVKFI